MSRKIFLLAWYAAMAAAYIVTFLLYLGVAPVPILSSVAVLSFLTAVYQALTDG